MDLKYKHIIIIVGNNISSAFNILILVLLLPFSYGQTNQLRPIRLFNGFGKPKSQLLKVAEEIDRLQEPVLETLISENI
jgi:hypothetical protein